MRRAEMVGVLAAMASMPGGTGKVASGGKAPRCENTHPDEGLPCQRPADHDGPCKHVARGVYLRWE